MTDTVESVLAEMRAEANVHTISMAHERTLQRLDGWADRLAAVHAREVGELRAEISVRGDYVNERLTARAEAAESVLRMIRNHTSVTSEQIAMIDELLSGAAMQPRVPVGGEG